MGKAGTTAHRGGTATAWVPAEEEAPGVPPAALSIGDAARLTGVSRAVLRLWERERLISPRRSPGGHRLYSAADLGRLRQIARLRRMDRLNAAAIRRELGTGEPTPEPDAGGLPAEPDLGPRLRALRLARGWSLAQVAAKAALSVSFLSAVERGLSSISVGNLFKLADAYGTTVPGLTAEQPAAARSVLRPAERPRYVAGRGRVTIEDLVSAPGALEAQRIEVLPGGGSEGCYAHPGEEFVYVLAGRLRFWIGETEDHRLEAGDSLSFRSTRPHRWRNEGGVPATVLWINVPVVDGGPAGSGRAGAAGRRPMEAAPASASRSGPATSRQASPGNEIGVVGQNRSGRMSQPGLAERTWLRPISIVEAPSNLGLRPSDTGKVPGVARLPAALKAAGLADRLGAANGGRVAPPPYAAHRDPTLDMLNPHAIRDFSLDLAERVGQVLDRGEFPFVLGGDCSILLGAMLALKRRGRYGLFFLDGHVDFYTSPADSPTGGAAGMDLALACGYGPALLADLDGRGPLVRDDDLVVFGFREPDERAHGLPVLSQTRAQTHHLDRIRERGLDASMAEAMERLTSASLDGFWVHLDADVLDDAVMPAVDSRQPSGLCYDELSAILGIALASDRAVGIHVTIFDPDLDRDGSIARGFADAIDAGFGRARTPMDAQRRRRRRARPGNGNSANL